MGKSELDELNIDIKAFFKILFKEYLTILITIVFFGVLGLIKGYTDKVEYTATGQILPELSTATDGSFGGIAGIVGLGGLNFSKNQTNDAIRPDLYPNILQSTPFYLELLKQKVVDKNQKSKVFIDYFNEEFVDELDEEKKANNESQFKLADSSIINIDKALENKILFLKGKVKSGIDTKTGIISIAVELPDPVIAAQVLKFGISYLTEYITEYRTGKLYSDVKSLEKKVEKSTLDYFKDQRKRANYADLYNSSTIRMQSSDLSRERIEKDYKMTSSLYIELSKQLEEAKVKLQQETPVFKVLEPPKVPNYRSGPRKMIILAVSLFIGFLFGVIIAVLIRKNYKKIIS